MRDQEHAALRPALLPVSHEEEEEEEEEVEAVPTGTTQPLYKDSSNAGDGSSPEIADEAAAAPEPVPSPRGITNEGGNDDDDDDARAVAQDKDGPTPPAADADAREGPSTTPGASSLVTALVDTDAMIRRRKKIEASTPHGPRIAAPLGNLGGGSGGEVAGERLPTRRIVLECDDAKAKSRATTTAAASPPGVFAADNPKEAERKANSLAALEHRAAIGASKHDDDDNKVLAGQQRTRRSLQDLEEKTRRSGAASALATGPGAYRVSDPATYHHPPPRVERDELDPSPSPSPSQFIPTPEYIVEARLVMDESSSDDDTDVAGNSTKKVQSYDEETATKPDLKLLVEATPVQRPSAWKKWAWLAIALAAVAAVGTAIGVSLKPATQKPLAPLETNSTSTNAPPDRASIPTVTTSDPIKDFRSYLSASTLQAIEGSEPSAQARAYQWTVANPPREGNVVKRLVQRFAMASLYHATGGPDWTQRGGWLNGSVHECDWYHDPSLASSCPAGSDTVSKLGLVENNLKGIIPPELGLLTSLNYLLLSSNGRLDGTVPDIIANMTALSVFRVPSNGLSGPLPKLPPSTTSVAAGSNQFNGTLPDEYKKLTNLKEFLVRANALSGGMPDDVWPNWKLLESLDVSDNRFGGRIGPGIGLLTRLTTLGLMVNQFSGPLPTELGMLSALTDIFVGMNHFTSTLPTELATMSSLLYMDLSGNALTGTIPSVLMNLSELAELVLDANMLSGPIPTAVAHLSKLSGLSIPGNKLTGPIPTQIAALTGLEFLNLASNALAGPVPEQLGSLTSLVELHLAHNRLNHTLPTSLGRLVSASEIDFSHNNVTGTIPTELGMLSSLTLLALHGNSGIVGTVPVELCSLVRLNSVVISVDCQRVNCTCGCKCVGATTVPTRERRLVGRQLRRVP